MRKIARLVAAYPAADDREAAIAGAGPAGTYSAVVRGADTATGGTLVEVCALE